MVYGWGSDSERWSMSDGRTLVFAYRYVSLLFIFRLAYKKRWMLLSEFRREDAELTRAEVEQRYGTASPTPGVWDQYGLLIGFGALVTAMVVASFF